MRRAPRYDAEPLGGDAVALAAALSPDGARILTGHPDGRAAARADAAQRSKSSAVLGWGVTAKGVARSAVIGFVAAGALAAGVIAYRGAPRRPLHFTLYPDAAPPPPTPVPQPPSDQVIGLGDLNVIGKGGPSLPCEPMPESPTLYLSVFVAGLRPAVSDICSALRALGPKIEECHLNALRRQPAQAYKLDLDLSVGEHGKVERVTVRGHTPSDDRSLLGPCLARRMRKLKFDPLKVREVEIDLWLNFR